MRDALVDREPQRVVARITDAEGVGDIAQRGPGQDGAAGRQHGKWSRHDPSRGRGNKLVDIELRIQVRALAPEVTDHQAHGRHDLALHVEVPGLYVRVSELGIHGGHGYAAALGIGDQRPGAGERLSGSCSER